MKRILGATVVLAFAFGATTVLAQTSSPTPSTGSMHMESTTKHKGPGKNTKTKTEVVIGTVKTYDAGKKIVVTGPKDKEYSFDLDENVAMKGTVNTGDKVKVTYTKSSGGEKVTTIAPYTGKTKKHKSAKAA